MYLLSKEDIKKNRVNTIKQFYVLRYLKNNLNVNSFDLYLFNQDTIKVKDKNNEVLYFKFDEQLKKVVYNEKAIF